jgi:hypothetical protein
VIYLLGLTSTPRRGAVHCGLAIALLMSSSFNSLGNEPGRVAGPDADRSPESANCDRVLAPLASMLPAGVSLRDIDLEEELRLSELTAQDISAIKIHSAGVMSFWTFLKGPLKGKRPKFPLYLYGYNSMSPALNVSLELENPYRALGVSLEGFDHTERLMAALDQSDEYVVFFVPRKVLTHPDASCIRDEMLWYLQVPEPRMKRVYFVFGAYDLFDNYKNFETALPNLMDRVTRLYELIEASIGPDFPTN